MNVGIIVYSHTGNTLSVAQKLEKALYANGHTANIERVEAANFDPGKDSKVELTRAPELSAYDAVIFASPVNAFSLARVMKTYLSQVSGLERKKTYCFVTQALKKSWMGGNRAIRQIQSACKAKGAELKESGIVNWSGEKREEQIEDIVNRFSVM